MDIIVWGTGGLFQKFKEYLFQINIIRFCDNDISFTPYKQTNISAKKWK